MEFDMVAEAVRGVPYMEERQGRRVYEHVRDSGARDVLELGTAHGVAAAYMAAALEANGGGRVTTVEGARFAERWDPPPEEVLSRAAVADRVELVRIDHTTYDWWLKELVEGRSDRDGNCEPLFDFCYLDGAHDFTIDGLAVVLVEKLLRPGGWLLLDDLDWSYAKQPELYEASQFSESEFTQPHVRGVWELVVKQHPSFTEFHVEDEWWAWARKSPEEPRRLTVENTQPLWPLARAALRRQLHRLSRPADRRRS